MNKKTLTKPDGRALHLYSRNEISANNATSPSNEPVQGSPHLRWHPLRGEWVAYAAHRNDRTFLPPADYNPLAPSVSKEHPTEIPVGEYEIAVFENRFPSFVRGSKAHGICEVVVFTQDPNTSLGALPLSRIELLLEVWAERTREIASNAGIRYIMPFENRGVEMGVTLHHPHGQIYAYPFVPPVAERRDGRRMLFSHGSATSFVPTCARYPFETWVAPRRPVALLTDLSSAEKSDLAWVLKRVLLTFDAMWAKPFPYLLVVHQSQTDGEPHPEGHLRIEITPAYRAPGKLKFLAGTELGAGLFVNDSLPEEKAAELRAVKLDESEVMR